MNALFTGIYNLFISDTGHAFYTGTGGRFYLNKAPQAATFPYCVYHLIAANDELDFGEENEVFQVQFDVFTQNNSALSAGTLLAGLKSRFDDCALTVSGWRHIYMVREFVAPNNDLTEVPPIMGYSVQYEIMLEKAK